jgi:hypothetical protein
MPTRSPFRGNRPQKVDDVDAVRLERWQNALERALDHGGFAGERGKGFVKLLDRRRIDLEPRQIRVTELAKPLEVRSGVASELQDRRVRRHLRAPELVHEVDDRRVLGHVVGRPVVLAVRSAG